MNRVLMKSIVVTLLALSVQVWVTALADTVVRGRDLVQTAEQYVRLQSDWPDADLAVELARPVNDVTLPGSQASYVVKEQEYSCIGSYATVPVVLIADGKPLRTVYISFKQRFYKNVAVTARPLKRHTELTATDIIIRREDVTQIRNKDSLFTALEDLIGLRNAVYLASGSTITASDMERIPLVLKNQQVKVLAQLGGIEATLFGIAEEDGSQGDVIKIQNPSSKTTFLAKVIKRNSVELVF